MDTEPHAALMSLSFGSVGKGQSLRWGHSLSDRPYHLDAKHRSLQLQAMSDMSMYILWFLLLFSTTFQLNLGSYLCNFHALFGVFFNCVLHATINCFEVIFMLIFYQLSNNKATSSVQPI